MAEISGQNMSKDTELKTGALHLRPMDNEEQYSDMLAYLYIIIRITNTIPRTY